jgi:hypothetical protein
VRKRGFEPPRGCPRQPLKLVRLPFRHFRVEVEYLSSIDRTDSVLKWRFFSDQPGHQV